MQDYSPLPVLHIHLMRLWTAWLDNFPEDFVNNPVIAVRMLYATASGLDNYLEDFIANPVIAGLETCDKMFPETILSWENQSLTKNHFPESKSHKRVLDPSLPRTSNRGLRLAVCGSTFKHNSI